MPLPKVTPIIVAALPIPETLNADELFDYHKKIVYGLLDRRIHVVSYACDGTETERSVQCMFLQAADRVIRHTIKNPRPGCPDIVVIIGVYKGNWIIPIQDSKHGLKTLRNNLFSGARLLTLGSYTAIYRHISELAQEAGSPLYHRDVIKLDRQDDLAATRLFSAATMEFLSKHHPEYLGEIVYLFVFGELIDAYQNRSISLKERVTMVLRTQYFVDYWRAFLAEVGYSETQYFISREAADILTYLINGLIGLVIVYRDHYQGQYPLFPWLHSSETCEHVFGEARQIVKDFTMLDFYYMLTKLRIKLREAAFRSHTTSFKACAAGYCHTYSDAKGVDYSGLAQFPADESFDDAAAEAMDQCNSLMALLGLNPSHLQSLLAKESFKPVLPSIASWLPNSAQDDGDLSDNGSDDGMSVYGSEYDEGNELQRLMELAEDENLSVSNKDSQRLTQLACAYAAVMNNEMAQM